jgi:hypothetical protein
MSLCCTARAGHSYRCPLYETSFCRVTKSIRYIPAKANSRSAAQEIPHLQSSFMRLQRPAMDPRHESDDIRSYPEIVLFKVHFNNIFLCFINGQ